MDNEKIRESVNHKNAQALHQKTQLQDTEISELNTKLIEMEKAMYGMGGRIAALERNLAVVVAGGYGSGPTA